MLDALEAHYVYELEQTKYTIVISVTTFRKLFDEQFATRKAAMEADIKKYSDQIDGMLPKASLCQMLILSEILEADELR